MVFTRHLLLGLIAEDRHPRGFLESGITIDKAREAVHTIWHSEEGGTDDLVAEEAVSVSKLTSKSTTDVPFSISTKRAFEALLLFKIECITIQLLVAKKRFKSFHKISFITIRQETSKASIQSNTSPATKPLLERLDKIDSYYSVTFNCFMIKYPRAFCDLFERIRSHDLFVTFFMLFFC
ncbi:hypothetical protein ACOSQ4_000219 [Xanthoceras sorbifolium]